MPITPYLAYQAFEPETIETSRRESHQPSAARHSRSGCASHNDAERIGLSDESHQLRQGHALIIDVSQLPVSVMHDETVGRYFSRPERGEATSGQSP